MITAATNGTNSFNPVSREWSEFNDVISEIAQMQSLVNCADVLVRHADNLNYDKPNVRLEHANCVLALIDSMDYKVKSILNHIERVYEMIFAHK